MTIQIFHLLSLFFLPDEVPLILGESTVIIARKITKMCNKLNILMERFDLSLVIRDPKIEPCCRNALQGRRRDLSSQEASLIRYILMEQNFSKS